MRWSAGRWRRRQPFRSPVCDCRMLALAASEPPVPRETRCRLNSRRAELARARPWNRTFQQPDRGGAATHLGRDAAALEARPPRERAAALCDDVAGRFESACGRPVHGPIPSASSRRSIASRLLLSGSRLGPHLAMEHDFDLAGASSIRSCDFLATAIERPRFGSART